MTQFIIFLVIGTVGILVGYFLAVRNKARRINAHVAQQMTEKEERKREILRMLNEKGEIANDDVEGALDVSDATATNYLQELEDERRIVQIGREGRFVKYRLK